MNISISDPTLVRALADNPNFKSAILNPIEPNEHRYKPGDTCTLTDLVDFPEFNGTTVEIISARSDGPHGKCYYIKGDINKYLNWTYEYRLTTQPDPQLMDLIHISPEADRLIEELDAALFSGDTFYSHEAVTTLRENLLRWSRQIDEIADLLSSYPPSRP